MSERFQFQNFPTIISGRLKLRQANFGDIEAILNLRSSEEINKFIPTKRIQNSEESKDFIILCQKLYKEQIRIFWLIEFESKVIGSIILYNISLERKYAKIGYKLQPKYQQKGVMGESLKTVLKFGFEKINLKTIEAFTHNNNVASIALLEKYHFLMLPEVRKECYEDIRIYRLTV